MRFSINIDYPPEKALLSRKRMEARAEFRYVDRVPVLFCAVPRYFAPIFGLEYSEFFKDVETQYYWQLQFIKYRIENIPEDFCTGETIYVSPYFDNVVNASAFGAEIAWPDTGPPRAIPTIKNIDDIDKFEIPQPNAGLWGKKIEWWHKMKEFAADTEVTIGGKKGKVDVDFLIAGGEGPHMTAIDLAGEDFYWWMIEHPESCHKLMDKITKGMLQAEKYCREIDPRPRPGYGIAEDAIQICSADMFREFCVPYDDMLYEAFGKGLTNGRGMHMCGDSNHLLKSLLEDAGISSFDIFGYKVRPQTAAKIFGGKVYMWGNVNPMLMLNGTKKEVKAAAKDCLEALGPCGGFILGDGANVCPGTPVENLAAFVEASEEYAFPAGTVPVIPA